MGEVIFAFSFPSLAEACAHGNFGCPDSDEVGVYHVAYHPSMGVWDRWVDEMVFAYSPYWAPPAVVRTTATGVIVTFPDQSRVLMDRDYTMTVIERASL
jgi:hypothetical protein